MFKNFQKIFAILSIFLFMLPKTAHAYLDPGAGSQMFQILAASFVGGIFLIKSYWQSLKSFIDNKILKKDKLSDDKNDDESGE